MTSSAIKHPVELLRDGKGVYGIGVAEQVEIDHRPTDLIFRRDRLRESKTHRAVLQMITGGFRHGMFARMSEEHLRKVIHHGLLCRAGLPWPPPESPDTVSYWSSDPRQQVRNRKIFHGLRLGSLSIVNGLIGQALEEAADREAIMLARRFRFRNRYAIYRAAILSPRALQITAAFPALSVAIFANGSGGATDRAFYAAGLVDAGAPLKKIAELMRVPMAFRKIKPGAADLALFVSDVFNDQNLVHAYMPDSLPQMALWLRCICLAKESGPEFVEWVTRHSLEIGGTLSGVLSFINNVADWVQACHRASVPSHIFNAIAGGFCQPRGEQFVVRRFSPDMSLKTVTKLSCDWQRSSHRASVESQLLSSRRERPRWQAIERGVRPRAKRAS
jgi:hypothetical protein